MTEEEKSDLSLFGPEARQRAAAAARCSVMEVMPAYSPLLATVRLQVGAQHAIYSLGDDTAR